MQIPWHSLRLRYLSVFFFLRALSFSRLSVSHLVGELWLRLSGGPYSQSPAYLHTNLKIVVYLGLITGHFVSTKLAD